MSSGAGEGKGKSIEPFRCRHEQVRQHHEIRRVNYQGGIPAVPPYLTKLIVGLVQRDFDPDYASIPPHGRWQHFNAGGRDRIAELLSSWPHEIDPSERCRRLIDLFLVSVLLDAGAGTSWSYKSKQNGRIYKRSEGLAIASFEMFKDGLFSSNKQQRHQVDASGLKELTVEKMAAGLQVTEQNQMSGLEGRASLLIRLADALNNDTLFGADGRPGNMLGNSPRYTINSRTDTFRLPPLPPHNPSFLRPDRPSPNPLVRPHRRPGTHLAPLSHYPRWDLPRGRLAPRPHASPHNATLGNDCSIPQTDAMALLFPHAADVQANEHPLRGRRADDRPPRV